MKILCPRCNRSITVPYGERKTADDPVSKASLGAADKELDRLLSPDPIAVEEKVEPK